VYSLILLSQTGKSCFFGKLIVKMWFVHSTIHHRYSAKNHCDRYVIRLGNTDISFESLIISYAFSVTGSNSLKAKEILEIY